MSLNEGSGMKGSSKGNSVESSKEAFQKSKPKLVKQGTATSEITMSNFPSANPSAFTSHASINLDDNASVKSNRSAKSQDEKEGSGVTGAPGWVAPSAGGDIERLTNLLYHYEVMNLNQQRDIDHYKGTYDDLAKTIGLQERERLKTNKKLKTLESQMKFDKIAADGIKKKFNLLEIEVKDLRYARDTLTTDLNRYKAENAELLDMLNEDRSNRLKLMHENDKLKKHNAFLMTMQQQAEECNVKANNILLERLHQLESLVAINKVQSATISGQSEEMLVLTAEVETLRSEALDVSSQVIAHNETNADLKNVIRLLQDEVSRLRRELLLAAHDSTHRTISTAISRSSARRTNRYTATVKEVTPGGHPLLYEPLDVERRASTAMASINRGSGVSHERSARVEAARRSLSPESRSRGGSVGGAGAAGSGFLSGGEDSDWQQRHRSPSRLGVGESQYSEQTEMKGDASATRGDSRGVSQQQQLQPRTYFCNNEKTVFDDQKPAAVIDRENYLRAIQSRGSSRGGKSRGGVVTPLATLKRPPNLDRDHHLLLQSGGSLGSGSTLVEEFNGMMSPSGSQSAPQRQSGGVSRGVAAPAAEGLEEYSHSAERVEMLGKIAQSGIKPKKKRIGLHTGGEGRPKTVSSNSSSADAASLKESITSNMKKAYSMDPKSVSLFKHQTQQRGSHNQSAVSLLTTSIVTEEGLASPNQRSSNSSHAVLPTLPAIGAAGSDSVRESIGLNPTVSFSLGHNKVSADTSTAGADESKLHQHQQHAKKHVNSSATAPKSLYISRGLNLKHNEELDNQLNSFGAGSTKEILKKILGDREFL